MEALLTAIVADLETNLTYLEWVGVIEHEGLIPASPQFPMIGVIEGGYAAQSLPGKKDLETLNVGVVAYQQIILTEPGAAIMGSTAQLGDAGKGLLAIGADIKARLNDNVLAVAKIHYAHLERAQPSRPIADPNGEVIAMYKRFDFIYRRYV